MRQTREGFSCFRCGNEIHTPIVEVRSLERSDPSPIEVVDVTESGYPKVNATCSRCGNSEAYHTVSFVSGEHAGVSQERLVERFTCARCHYSWTEKV